uniref:Uncharacterized protein n=1 Tax=Romanomermis culicivorax TaxID=13658 RepID=A0A915HH24_ROMCU
MSSAVSSQLFNEVRASSMLGDLDLLSDDERLSNEPPEPQEWLEKQKRKEGRQVEDAKNNELNWLH